MTPVFSVRRRAEEFDSLVEGSSTGTHERYADLLDVVTTLRSTPGPEARPEFVSSLRDQLMLAADTMLVPSNDKLALPVRTKTPRDRRIAAAVGGFAIVGATTSMAMAAQSALPGDVLYPLKRAIENAEAGISVNDGQKGVTLLHTASGRLDEVSALTSNDGDGTAIAATLNTFTEQSVEASDLLLNDYEETGHQSSIAELLDFTSASMQTLADLESVIPAGARDELLHAASVLTQIDNEAQQACPTCGDGITEIPSILLSGGERPAPQVSSEQETSAGEKQKPGPSTGGGESGVPGTEQGSTLPDLTAGTETEDNNTGGGNDDSDEADPITTLAEGLAGGDSTPASNNGTIPGLPESDDASGLETVTDPLLGGGDDGEKSKKKN